MMLSSHIDGSYRLEFRTQTYQIQQEEGHPQPPLRLLGQR